MRNWLVALGAPTRDADVLVWAITLAVLALLLYVSFWPALLVLAFAAVAWPVDRDPLDDEDERYVMTHEEVRESPAYDPVPYEDTTHPDYVED